MQITKHIIYKEWIKIKWFTLICAILSVAVVIYIFASTVSQIGSNSPEQFFAQLLTSKDIFFGMYKYIPLLIALLIGVSQFLPEVTDKRIKLSLHLPVNGTRIVYSMVLFGFAVIATIIAVSVLLFVLLSQFYFPAEVIVPALLTMTPWILGGITTYFLIAMIAMEPVAKFRFLYSVVAYMIVAIFMKNYSIGNASVIIPILLGVTTVSSIAILFTSHRFNKGEL